MKSMRITFVVFFGLVLGLTILSHNVAAAEMTQTVSAGTFQRLEGTIVVDKDSTGAVTTIKIQPSDRSFVKIINDKSSEDMTKYIGKFAVVVGKYTEDGSLLVSSWFIRN